MSRDDYISKLFIQNQDKLDQAPSSDLWSKIESQLDVPDSPVGNSSIAKTTKVVSLTKYFAAASVVLLLACTAYFMSPEATPNQTLAMAEDANPTITTIEELPYDDSQEALHNTAAEQKELMEQEDKRQENKILQSVAKEVNTTEIKIADKIEDIALEEVVLVEVEEEPKDYISIEPETATNALPDVVEEQKPVVMQRNYAAAPTLNSTSNQQMADAIVQKNEDRTDYQIPSKLRNKKSKGRVAKKTKKSAYVSPMAMAHPRLQMFGWLLGKWMDDNETEGTSYEIWQLKSPNILQGKGYKLSSNKDLVFEEIMYIEYRAEVNQVFLTLSLNENREKLEYMLTQFDNERITFTQSASKKYPDELIIQRDLDGFTTILVHNQGFLDGDQQRYLENRNRVSNVRAIRTLHYEEE